ncbi:MAG: hypothetical protein Q9217_000733 [Psora testacea]
MAPEATVSPAKVSAKIATRAWEALTPELSDWILSAVSSMGFNRMTPVQASCIPLFMAHKDVVVEPNEPESASSDSESDEEKVAIYPPNTPIVLPQLLVAGDFTPAQDLSLFLHNSPNVLVATPGRLLELLLSSHVHCPQSSFEVLVLDEADRLLDMGFKEDLQKILARLPKQRRTGLFSATVGEAVDHIVRVGLRNPVRIAVKVRGIDGSEDRRTPARYVHILDLASQLTQASLQMSYLVKPASQTFPAICKILSSLTPCPHKSIVYLSTCAAVEYFQYILPAILPQRDGQTFALVPLHGKQQQKIRQNNFAKFANTTKPTILLTTDVAARGLDIPKVDLVLQVDPPNDPKVFLHRCGRAGRAGRKGLSIVFLQPGREEDYLLFLEVRKTPLTEFTLVDSSIFDGEVRQATAMMRSLVLTDRALHDRAQRGFVSWAKAYSKHQASSIFRLADQDWTDLGIAWALLKLPKMPELKNWEGDKSLGVEIDWQTYAYKDKAQEQARLKPKFEENQPHLASTKLSAKKEAKGAWSQKLHHRDEREVRRSKKQKRRERDKWEHMTLAERQKHQELDDMIQAVRRKKLEDDRYGEFEGFDD